MTKNNFDMSQLVELAMKQQQAQQMSQPSRSGLSYCECLSLILITLKCLGTISCSWLIPFMPLLIPFVLYGVVVLAGYLKAKFFTK